MDKRARWGSSRCGELLCTVSDYHGLISAVRLRKDALAFSNLELDSYAGLSPGATSKILCGTKSAGPLSLSVLLAALGLRLGIIVDKAPQPSKPKDFAQDRSRPDDALASVDEVLGVVVPPSNNSEPKS